MMGRFGLFLPLTSALLLAPLEHAPAQAGTALVEIARTQLPATDADGNPVEEVSGLAWDDDARVLFAVSDNGLLFHIRLRIDEDSTLNTSVVKTVRLEGGPGALRNAEGLEIINGANGIDGDSQLLVVYEDGPALRVHSTDGIIVDSLAVPEPLRDTGRYQSANDGIESTTVDASQNVLVAPELPLQGLPNDRHVVYGTDGSTLVFERLRGSSAATGRIKALSFSPSLGLFTLERLRDDATSEYVSVIRRVAGCSVAPAARCDATVVADPSRSLHGLPLEGMAFVNGTTAVLAADTKKKNVGTTLIVVRLITGAE